MSWRIVPIERRHIAGFREVVDGVARERRYLAFLEAPPMARMRRFVLDGLRTGISQYVAVDADRWSAGATSFRSRTRHSATAARWAWAWPPRIAASGSALPAPDDARRRICTWTHARRARRARRQRARDRALPPARLRVRGTAAALHRRGRHERTTRCRWRGSPEQGAALLRSTGLTGTTRRPAEPTVACAAGSSAGSARAGTPSGRRARAGP
jgi:hypothetical protein